MAARATRRQRQQWSGRSVVLFGVLAVGGATHAQDTTPIPQPANPVSSSPNTDGATVVNSTPTPTPSLPAPALLAPALALTPQGPIPVRNLDPLNSPFLLPVPAMGGILSKGASRRGLDLEIANNFNNQQASGGRAYITDFEEQRFTASYEHGLGHRQEFMLRLPLIARDKGFLDRVINSYDRLINQQGSGRDKAPSFRDIYQVTDTAGNVVINDTHSTIGLGDTTLEYRLGLTSEPAAGTRQPLQASLRGLVKLPTGSKSRLLGSGGADFGIGLAATWQPTRRIALHGNVTPVFLGSANLNGLQKRSEVTHLVIAGEYLLGRRTSFLLQTDYNPLPVRNAFATTETRKSLTLGLWHKTSPRTAYFASFTENKLGPFGSQTGAAPDITLSFGLRCNR